ncbi:MAG: hypothetical protein RRA92_09090 [Gemmatimonadota bacterium]|nr:hypothetical protein [Gemmatimonadota bacterium]
MERSPDPRPRREKGYALPAVLGVLILVSILGAAAYEASRLEGLSVRGLASSVRAFYGAESGLAALAAGRPAGLDTTLVTGLRVQTRRTVLVRLEDGTRIVRFDSEAAAPGPGGGRGATRHVTRLAVESDAGILPLAGSWRERFRP